MLRINDVVCREYRIQEVLGSAGHEAEYIARSSRGGLLVCIRHIWKVKERCAADMAALEAAVKLRQTVKHQAIPRVVQFVKQLKQWFIVEEYSPRVSLEQWYRGTFQETRFEELLNIPEIYGRVAPSASFVAQRVLQTGYQRVVRECAQNCGARPVDFAALGLGSNFQRNLRVGGRLEKAGEILGGQTQQHYAEAVVSVYMQLIEACEFLSSVGEDAAQFALGPENIFVTEDLDLKLCYLFEKREAGRSGPMHIPELPFKPAEWNKLVVNAVTFQMLNGYSAFMLTRNRLFQQLQAEYTLALPGGLLGSFTAADGFNSLLKSYFDLKVLKKTSWRKLAENMMLLSQEVDISQHMDQSVKSSVVGSQDVENEKTAQKPRQINIQVVGEQRVGRETLVRCLSKGPVLNKTGVRHFLGHRIVISVNTITAQTPSNDHPDALLAVFSLQRLESLLGLSELIRATLQHAPDTLVYLVGNDFGGSTETADPQLCRYFRLTRLDLQPDVDHVLRDILKDVCGVV